MVEASIGSLQLVPDIPNPIIPENGIVDEERRPEDIKIHLTDESDIQMTDR